CRIIGEKIACNPAHAILRNQVPRERNACDGVDDLGGRHQVGKIAALDVVGRNRVDLGNAAARTESLVVAKEPGLLPDNGPTQRVAKLVKLELGLAPVEEVSRIEVVVAQEMEGSAVKLVG